MKIILPEHKLIAAIQGRDRIGAEALYDMYSSSLFGVIFKIVKHQEIAEDILQQTMLKIWQSIDSYHLQKGRLYTWMVTIARNLSKDALRSKAYHNHLNNSDLAAVEFEVDQHYQSVMNIDLLGIKEFMNRLRKDHREILDLIYYKGYTHSEVAEELQIPIGTVKTRWTKGIALLKKMVA